MQWKKELISVEHEPRWVSRYIKFIDYCKSCDINIDEYTENHHILPKSIFPNFSKFTDYPWNKITLTARQHFIAHYMLAKLYGGKMWYAYNMMINCDEFGKRVYTIGSVFYEKARISYSLEVSKQSSGENNYWYGKDRSGELNPMFGREQTEETKAKIGEKAKERFEDPTYRIKYVGKNNGMYGKKKSEDVKQRTAASRKITFASLPEDHYWKKCSEAAKIKMSESKKDMQRVIKIDGYFIVKKSKLKYYFFRNGYYFDYQDSSNDKESIERYKSKISMKGIKNSDEAKLNKKKARLNTKKVIKKAGSFLYIKEYDLHKFFKHSDNKYYDYPEE